MPLGWVGVAIVDDDERFRLFVQNNLDQTREFRCVGSYSSGEEALIGLPQSGAQVVFMDIKMPGMSGIESARRLKALLPHLIIVMVTGLDDPRTINLARECGAEGFLPKPFTAGQLMTTLSFYFPRSTVKVTEPQTSGKRARRGATSSPALSKRENEVMRCFAKGLYYKEIASELGISYSAVHKHQHNIFVKFHVGNSREAIRKWHDSQRA